MKISIVTLSFNQSKYLVAAIESILRQGYQSLEYIVVDPGSTDGSRAIIDSYGDQIAHRLFEKDKGAADGLNKGFALASGDIFGFLNADDLLLPGSLETVAKFFQQNPEIGMALGNGIVIDGEGHTLRHVRARSFTVDRYLHAGARFLQQSTFFRRETFLASGGFNVANRCCWDGELFVGMARQGIRIGYISADLAAFRLHGESISGSNRLLKAYLAESKRIFRDMAGRDWDLRDDVLRALYRSEGYLRQVFSGLRESERGGAR